VTINELFRTLPVRRRELLKNIKREFAKAQSLLQAYAIISRGVRWVVSNTVKGRRSNVMTISSSSTHNYIRSNVTAVFGSKACNFLHPMDVQIPLSKSVGKMIGGKRSLSSIADDEEDDSQPLGTVQVEGLISRPTHGFGRSASDRIFLYINGRPWDSSRIVRAVNEVYRSFNSNQYPMVVANFTVKGDKYDVNVSPDKRTLFLHDENEIIEGIKVSVCWGVSPLGITVLKPLPPHSLEDFP
jgi:DNA mismatch repair protein PMS2